MKSAEGVTHSVMDTLDYGISSPQLAMMNNGQVFVAGQYQAPMNPPTSQTQAQTSGIRPMGLVNQIIQAGSDLFGSIIATNWVDFPPQPEEAALFNGSTAAATSPATGSWGEPAGRTPSQARIAIPLPTSADVVTTPLTMHYGANLRQRYFILTETLPSSSYQVTAISVSVTAGTQSQVILDHQPVSQMANDPYCSQIYSQNDIPLAEYLTALTGEDQFSASEITQETSREILRKQWGRQSGALPSQASPSSLTQYFRVLVTFDSSHPATINYGLINGVAVPAPSNTLTYTFTLHYKWNGLPLTFNRVISVGHCPVQAQWSAAQFLMNQQFGSWNNDKWCSQGLFNWMLNTSSRQSIGPVNDISLEHGRNTGHTGEHLCGDAVDVYHPGFSFLINSNTNGNPSMSGSAFMNAEIIPLLKAALGEGPDVVDRQNLVSWIYQARQTLQGMLLGMNSGGQFVGSGLYLQDDAVGGYYAGVRDLIWTGQYPAPPAIPTLDLTSDIVDEEAMPLGPWTWPGYSAQINSITSDDTGLVHTTHMHIRPQGRIFNRAQ